MYKDLASHPLMKRVFENVKPTLDGSTERLKKAALKGKICAESEGAITESQSYQVDVFQRANAVLDCVYQLEDIRKFIKRFPSPRTYEKEGISQYRWIEYHYSFFVVTLVSMQDTALILVNAVFRLGNPEKSCRAEIIKKNECVRNSGVNKRLDKLEAIVSPHRPVRNSYVHRRMAPELYKIFGSNLLDHLKLHSFINLHHDPIVDKQLMDLAFKGETTKISERLGTEISKGKDAVWRLFDSLFPIYQGHTASLQ